MNDLNEKNRETLKLGWFEGLAKLGPVETETVTSLEKHVNKLTDKEVEKELLWVQSQNK